MEKILYLKECMHLVSSHEFATVFSCETYHIFTKSAYIYSVTKSLMVICLCR